MTRTLTAALIAGSMTIAAPAIAQNTIAPMKPTPAMKTMSGMKTTTAHTMTKKTVTRSAAPAGRMVSTKTKSGKTITYDCGKAGNAKKAVCKQ